jgi:hypothetical protein
VQSRLDKENNLDEKDEEPIDSIEESSFIGANHDRFYTFNMSEGQELVGAVSSDGFICILICEESDYEEWNDRDDDDDDQSYPDYYFLAEDVRHRRFKFIAPHDDTFVLVLMNRTEEDIDVVIDCAQWETADEE